MISSSTYQSVARAFTVVEVADPINTTIDPNSTLEEALKLMSQSPNNQPFALVEDQTTFCGFVTQDGEYFVTNRGALAAVKVRDVAETVTPAMLVPSSLPVVELLKAVGRHPFFFVLDAGRLTHVVTADFVDREPVKLAVFALLMELEGLLLDLLSGGSKEEMRSHLEKLSAGRLEQAMDLSQHKYGEVTPWGTILSTTFIDRTTMVLKHPEYFEYFPFPSKNQAESFFNLVQAVRNQVAHGLDISTVIASPEELEVFLQTVDRTVTNVRTLTVAVKGG